MLEFLLTFLCCITFKIYYGISCMELRVHLDDPILASKANITTWVGGFMAYLSGVGLILTSQ